MQAAHQAALRAPGSALGARFRYSQPAGLRGAPLSLSSTVRSRAVKAVPRQRFDAHRLSIRASALVATNGNGNGNCNGHAALTFAYERAAAAAAVADDEPSTSSSMPPVPQSGKLRVVLPYLWRIACGDVQLRPRLASALVMLVLAKGFGLAVPLLFKFAVDALTAGGPSAANSAGAALLLAGVARALGGLATELRVISFMPVAQSASRRVALQAFEHVLSLDLQFHLQRQTGNLSRIIDRGTRSVAMVFRAVVFTFLPTFVELIAVSALLWHAFSGVFVLMLLATFVVYVGWTVVLTQLSAERRMVANKLDAEASGKAVDALLNYETVALFGNVGREAKNYNVLLEQFHRAALYAEEASCALNAGQAVSLSVGMAAIMAGAAWAWGGSHGTVGDIVMANGLLLQLWAPLNFLGFFYRELRQTLVDMEAMFEVLSRKSSIVDGARPVAAGGAGVPGMAVELRDVTFSYGDGRDILRGVSFKVAPGESIGIVGPSGSGKSTLLRLILRMYDPVEGAILVDGIDARDVRLASFRAAAAVVPQECALFNTTLLDNIAYGRANASREEARAAADAAQLTAALGALPSGLDTVVGERGVKLSGGEKQRVAIARAVLRNPRLLIADEATSALDTATEAGILGSLREVATGRTFISVAHRLSTVRHCDRIVVLDKGRVAEIGSHNDLMALGGLYSRMWAAQQAEEDEAAERGEDIVLA